MANAPYFFKIILEDVIQEGKLRIPSKFVRKYGNYLQERVFLNVPSGVKWQVELVRSGDAIWFGNGWQHFVDYYSLSLGSFLVFGFEDFKSCTFNVLIFDKTASEIDYPLNAHEDDEEPNLEEQFHQPINQVDEDKSPSPFSRPRKKRKQESYRTQSEATGGNGNRFDKNDNALHRASSSRISDNSSFSIVMQPSYICDKRRVTIPASFAKKYFRERKGIIFLNSVDGKTWSVKYTSYRVNSVNCRLTMISCGWKKFAEENHLEIGDVCIFQPIDHNASKLQVVIRKANHESAKSIPSIACTNDVYGGMQESEHGKDDVPS